MLEGTRNWFRRNRYNFAIGAGVLGVGYLAGQYAVSKLTEARQRMSEDRIAKENLRRRFEQNQEDCTLTVLALLPTLKEDVFEALPVEKTLDELQQKRAERLARSAGGASDAASSDMPTTAVPSTVDEDGRSHKSGESSSFVHASQMGESASGPSSGNNLAPPGGRGKKNKTQLWNEMKIDSISRAFSLIYGLSLLTLFTRIQLNLLGRRSYLSSVVSLASPSQMDPRISLENNDDDTFTTTYGNDFETNRQYLAFSWWLLHRGSKQIIERVTAAVKEIFGPLNPREEITFEKLSELTLSVRKIVEGATPEARRNTTWLPYLLPPRNLEHQILLDSGISPPPTSTPPQLRRLLDETSDLIESPTFAHVHTLILDAAFSHLIDVRLATAAYKRSADPAALPPSDRRILELEDDDAAASAPRVRARVAALLSVFCRQAHAIAAGDGDGPGGAAAALGEMTPNFSSQNEYLAAMEAVRDLDAFAAVVYSSNFEFEDPDAAAASRRRPDDDDGDGEDAGEGGAVGGLGTGGDESSGMQSAWEKAIVMEEDGKG